MGNISYPPLTNERVLFATRAAAAAFFDAFNTSDASPTEAGAMKQSTLPGESTPVVTPTYAQIQVLQADGSYVNVDVPNREDYDELLAVVLDLQTKYNALRDAMVTSGQGIPE